MPVVLIRTKRHEVPDDGYALGSESRLTTDGAAEPGRGEALNLVRRQPARVACRARAHGDRHRATIWGKGDDMSTIITAPRTGGPIPASGQVRSKIAVGKGIAFVTHLPEAETREADDECDERSDNLQDLLH